MAVNHKDMLEGFAENVNLRSMEYDDLSTIMTIEQVAYTHPWTLGIFRDCLRVGYRCWVAERDKKIIGYGIVMIAAGEAHILNICIHPDFQGTGNGRALLCFLVEQCRVIGADMVLLEVRRSNAKAIALYHDSGFHELGVRQDYYPSDKGREDAIMLARYLESDKP